MKSRITRIAAFLLSCALIGVFSFRVMGFAINNNIRDTDDYMMNPYHVSNAVVEEMNDVYYKLWAIGAMWLRNLDEDGKFKGTKELEKQTVNALKKLDCMDEDGKLMIQIGNYDFDFLVSYGDNKFTNTNKKYDDFENTYSVKRKNDNINISNGMMWYNNNSFNMYDTNYGMHYYFLDGKGVALFDFDTAGLPSYIDELGATMYYKTDGTTPMPVSKTSEIFYQDNDGRYFSEYGRTSNGYYSMGEYIEDDEEYNEDPLFEDGSYYVYEQNRSRFRKVILPTEDSFSKVQVQEMALTIAIRPEDEIVQTFHEYDEYAKTRDKNAVRTFMNNLPLVAVAFILALYVIALGGYDTKKKAFSMSAVDKVFAELPFIVAVGACILAGAVLDYNGVYSFFNVYYNKSMMLTFYTVLYPVLFGVFVLMIDTLVVRIKCKSFWKSTFTLTALVIIYGWLKRFTNKMAEKTIDRDMLRHDKFTRRFIVRTVALFLCEIVAVSICIDFHEYFAMLLMSATLFAAYVFFSMIDLRAVSNVSRHISAINKGDYTIQTEPKNSAAYCMTEKLNNISAGIQNAVDRQLKSERMKIELVTNVSHDLKTPLTSIISYINLLSMEELTPVAKDYVSIIEKKSQHLKNMVADLFDLAKATSRTDIEMERIDAVILTNQVLADLSDKIEATGKQIKTDIKPEVAPIMAEGKKMYRVLQNIIDNALKYSLDNTRIYLTLRNESGYCLITVKNIASYEMNFAPDEITERFTRGDESRSTEGNGLGLSIAKSFTEACGGMFGITIDGDMFIAEVKIPMITISTEE